jgi:8-oxo-dGTP pyrophosphatase MutT (NUDIX family)
MKAIDRRIVAAHIVSNDNKVLFGRKLPGTGAVYEDAWHIPGGGVDPGESDEVAVRREVHEETGLDLKNATVTLIDDKGVGEAVKTIGGEPVLVKMIFMIYKIQLTENASDVRVVEGDDLVGFEWFDIDELLAMNLTPPGKALFKRIGIDWLYK